MAGVTVIEVVELPITWEGFIKFMYAGEAFDLGTGFGDYYDVTVNNPACPEQTLWIVVNHLSSLLGEPWQPQAQNT